MTPLSAAIAGMAAMVGAGAGGVMTAIVMAFEMTRDYAIIVPVIVAVALAAGVRRALIRDDLHRQAASTISSRSAQSSAAAATCRASCWRASSAAAGAAIVFHGAHRPRAVDVVGVIAKPAIAHAVIDNYAG